MHAAGRARGGRRAGGSRATPGPPARPAGHGTAPRTRHAKPARDACDARHARPLTPAAPHQHRVVSPLHTLQ
jgi:hypothetical protein